MLKLDSLYMSSQILNQKSDLEKTFHMNTFYRIWVLCEANGFRSVKNNEVRITLRKELNALGEDQKILSYLCAT